MTASLTLVTASLWCRSAPLSGADLSHLRFFEDRGVVYRDANGARDALEILRDQGLRYVRLRLFTSTEEQAAADPYNAINNLTYTVPLAARIKQAGFELLLDFHYSDSWADPGKQSKPAAWAGLSFPDLEQRVQEYTRDAILLFREAGAMPETVQVGNEIIGGMLWPDGKVGGAYDTDVQWSQFGRLLKAAVQGVKDGSGDLRPAIMVHIDRGADWGGTQWFFDRLAGEQVEFDLIGQSYYPFWHGSLNALRTCLNWAAVRYGKPVWVVETAFPWNGSATIEGIPSTPSGQVHYAVELAKIVAAVPGWRGRGIIWWGAEYVRIPGMNLAGFDQRSFFDFSGQTLPVVGALGQLNTPVRLRGARVGEGLTLHWPLSGAGMQLTSTPGLSIAGEWAPVDTLPEWQEDAFTITLPTSDRQRQFRLEGP